MGHALQGEDLGGLIIWRADTEKLDRDNTFQQAPQGKRCCFTTLTTEFLPQPHYVKGIIIPFHGEG